MVGYLCPRKRLAEIEEEKRMMGDLAAPPKQVVSDYEAPRYKDSWESRDSEEHEVRNGGR